MKKFSLLVGIFIGALLFSTSIATATSTLLVQQGGTSVNTFTPSGLVAGNGTNPLYTTATTTASCSGSASCSSFTILGSTPITISATGGGGSSFGNIFNFVQGIPNYLIGTTSPLGLIMTASSTIGDGTQTGGLTISGNATTTGNIYAAGNLGVGSGEVVQTSVLQVLGSTSNGLRIDDVTAASANNLQLNTGGLTMNRSNGSGQSFTLSTVSTGTFAAGGGNIIFSPNSAEAMRIVVGGNVGIGTTTPDAKLSIQTSNLIAADFTSGGSDFLTLGRVGGTNSGVINAPLGNSTLVLQSLGNNVGVGTTSPFAQLSIQANNGSTQKNLFAIGSSTQSATTTLFSVDNAGDVTATVGIITLPANIVIQANGSTNFGGHTLSNVGGLTASAITDSSLSGGTVNVATGGLFYNTATSSLSANATLTFTGTAGALIGGTSLTAGLNLANPNTWTGLQQFGNATSTLFTVSGTEWNIPLATPAGAFLAVDPNGKVIATSSPTGTNYWTLSGNNIFNNNNGSNGFVGIGTSTPWGLLSISTTTSLTMASSSIYSTPGTYTNISVPANTAKIIMYAWGGGGGGPGFASGAGGGAGGYVTQTITGSNVPSIISIYVAQGGQGQTGGTGFASGGAGGLGGGGGGSSAVISTTGGSVSVIAAGGGGGGVGSGSTGGGAAASTNGGNGGNSGGGNIGGGGGGANSIGGAGGIPTGGTGGTGGTTVSATGGAGANATGSGAGGGSAGGASGNGNAGSGTTGGTGSGGASPGANGTGMDSGGGGSGSTGGNPGAGAGNSGNGGNGQIIIQYYTLPAVSAPAFALQAASNEIAEYISGAITGISTLFEEIDPFGHLITGGIAPTCGTGCASVQGDDRTFRIVTGTGVTAVTVNFSHTYTNTPVTICSDESGGTTVADASSSPASVTLNLSASLTAKSIACIAQISNNFTF